MLLLCEYSESQIGNVIYRHIDYIITLHPQQVHLLHKLGYYRTHTNPTLEIIIQTLGDKT